jgi:hypothetical protein
LLSGSQKPAKLVATNIEMIICLPGTRAFKREAELWQYLVLKTTAKKNPLCPRASGGKADFEVTSAWG